jgi:epsilon-lactone hydrolase
MASIRSLWVRLAMKLFVKRSIRSDMDVVAERGRLSRFDRFASPIPPHIEIQGKEYSGVPVTYLANRNKASELVILYLHGGGFLWEMKAPYQSFVAEFCEQLKGDAYIPWYRLAPEHPYPAAPDDCFAVYRALLESGIEAKNIIVAGDSAGGTLALNTLLRIRESALEMPAAAVLLSPMTDLAEQSGTWILNGWSGKDPLFPKDAFSLTRHYCADWSRTDPLMSPYYADFRDFPPLMFIVSHAESLLEDSISVAKKARAAEVAVQVQVWRGMPHVFPIIGFLPEAREVKAEIRQFMQACLPSAKEPYFAVDGPLIVMH